MPDQVNVYRGKNCRVQFLCPDMRYGEEARYYDIDGADFLFKHIKHFKDEELEHETGITVEGSFRLVVSGTSGREKVAYETEPVWMANRQKAFEEKIEYLKRRDGLRVIRFNKKKEA